MKPKILIVGTVPYNQKATSRAFEAYFSGWEKENCRQIFSHPRTPVKGHCGELYQITDQQLLKGCFSRGKRVGRRFVYDELPDEWPNDNTKGVKNPLFRKLYAIGSKKRPITCLLRGWLWNKKRWCTKELNDWLDDFAPDCVFLSFSDDFFIPRIALYVAQRYAIPIVSSIGDDYYFNDKRSLSPFYHLYRRRYKRLIDRVFAHGGSAIYISDKIRDKYNAAFGLHGETVYLTSEVSRRPFRPIDRACPVVSYFGNIRQGRNESLAAIGAALGQVNPAYMLDVYSNQDDPEIVRVLENEPHVRFHGSIPYAQVAEKTTKSDIVVIVEGFKPQHVNITRYSLSTKAADSLASGAAILVYGSAECGVIEYMQSTRAAAVCTDPTKLADTIRRLIDDPVRQRAQYDKAIDITNAHHNLARSTAVFQSVVEEAIRLHENPTTLF